MQERIKYETNIADKTCDFSSLFRFPRQSKYEFESFADKLDLNFDSVDIRNTYFIVVSGEFNAQTKWWHSLGKTTYESTRIDGITYLFGLEKLIHKPNHLFEEGSSCTHLIFLSDTNLPVKSVLLKLSSLNSPRMV